MPSAIRVGSGTHIVSLVSSRCFVVQAPADHGHAGSHGLEVRELAEGRQEVGQADVVPGHWASLHLALLAVVSRMPASSKTALPTVHLHMVQHQHKLSNPSRDVAD